jgi:SpoIID/LytB domain protein
VEQVPLERYLEGVLPHEIGAGAPAAALAAQAVLARTWALRNQHRFAVDGYHLCADTQCQVYSDPRQAGAGVRRAIAATRGQVLSWQRRPIHAVYHASNGGVAAGYEEAWAGTGLPYLRPAVDGPPSLVAALPLPLTEGGRLRTLLQRGDQAYGAAHPLFRWTRRFDRSQIVQALGPRAAAIGSLQQVQVLERGPSGRVVRLALRGSAGEVVLQRDAIRRTLRGLPSTLFDLTSAGPGVWRFEGGGFGHGAGLSQAGAIDLASRGWSLERILSRYYPGTTLVGLESLAPTGSSGGGP